MTYYDVSKIFWLLAAPTNALVLISAIAALWAVLSGWKIAARLTAAAACMLVIGTFTPIGAALTGPLEYRFARPRPDSQAAPDGIILLGGGGIGGIDAVLRLSKDYPKARLIFTGFAPDKGTATFDKYLLTMFARLGGDPTRIYMDSRPQTTSEDAVYTAAVVQPKPSERWLLVTSALHMPRSVGCFRAVGFQLVPYPIEFRTVQSHPSHRFAAGSPALNRFDTAAREWIGLVAYRLMGKTDALFPGP